MPTRNVVLTERQEALTEALGPDRTLPEREHAARRSPTGRDPRGRGGREARGSPRRGDGRRRRVRRGEFWDFAGAPELVDYLAALSDRVLRSGDSRDP